MLLERRRKLIKAFLTEKSRGGGCMTHNPAPSPQKPIICFITAELKNIS